MLAVCMGRAKPSKAGGDFNSVPGRSPNPEARQRWWPLQNSNLRPPLCESGALTN
jgi:hypothetical protein